MAGYAFGFNPPLPAMPQVDLSLKSVSHD